jgi:hypothetical protein
MVGMLHNVGFKELNILDIWSRAYYGDISWLYLVMVKGCSIVVGSEERCKHD